MSGFWVMSGAKLTAGDFCTVNGFVGQVSVQAADLSTLVIAIVTFIGLARPQKSERWLHKLGEHWHWMLLIIWTIPLITATIAYFWVGYGPSGGNYCWISGKTPDNMVARYVLTLFLRLLIFLIILVLYTYLYIFIRRHYDIEQSNQTESPAELEKRRQMGRVLTLLKLYPTIYICLWSSNMIFRGLQAVDPHKKCDILKFMSLSNQYIGLADAIAYGWTIRSEFRDNQQKQMEKIVNNIDYRPSISKPDAAHLRT
jgi:hypothetical protein